MILDCPFCATRYRLAEPLLGPGGARVRCPRCGQRFAVSASGAPPAADARAAPAPVAVAEPAAAAALIADQRIAALIEHGGEELRGARERGVLFAEWGPWILEAFDDFRRRAGEGADPRLFRKALRDQLGVELPDPSRD